MTARSDQFSGMRKNAESVSDVDLSSANLGPGDSERGWYLPVGQNGPTALAAVGELTIKVQRIDFTNSLRGSQRLVSKRRQQFSGKEGLGHIPEHRPVSPPRR